MLLLQMTILLTICDFLKIDVKPWKHRSMEVWRHEAWRHGGMEAWRHQSDRYKPLSFKMREMRENK